MRMSRAKRILVAAALLLTFAAASGAAQEIGTQGWIDGPFFELLGRFGELYSAYTATAYGIGRILLMVDLGLMAIMWALNGGEVQKELNRRLLTILVVTVMMVWYPSIMTGVMRFAQEVGLVPVRAALKDAQATMQAQAEGLLKDYYEKVAKGDRSAKVPTNYKSLAASAKANISLTGTFSFKGANGRPIQAQFIRPDGIMKYTMIIATPLYAASFKGNLLTNAGHMLLCMVALLAMMICASIVALQYIMAMVEYQIILGVGILLVPFALFDKSRFVTEKFIGAVFAHLIKIVLVIVIIGVFSGAFVSLAKVSFTGSLDQIVKYVFTMLLYAILASSVPAIATGILSGSPSLTGEVVLNTVRTVTQGIQTAGVVAGAAKLLGTGAMQAGYQGVSRAVGALSEAGGAARSAGQAAMGSLTRGEDGYFYRQDKVAGQAARQAFAKSLAGSLGSALRSAGHTLSHSLGSPSHSHSPSGLRGRRSKPPAWQSNPHSQAHQLSKTPGLLSYAKARAAKGAAKGRDAEE
jgi:type IV secretory pathway TrbL component